MLKNSIFLQFKNTVFSDPTRVIFEDLLGKKLRTGSLFFKSLFLSLILKDKLGNSKVIGVCLPNTTVFPIVFLGLQSRGYIPAILNYKSGVTSIINATKASGIHNIITSRMFEEKAGLAATFMELKQKKLNFIYLEDVMSTIGILKKLAYLTKMFCTKAYEANENEPAVILFTSGSEGNPKGVVLSHRNLISNVGQVCDRIEFGKNDILFSSLPFFHAFGLLAGVILPILNTTKSYLYPTPLDYKTIPQKIEDSKATVLFSANTFLQGYAAHAHPGMFKNLKAIYAGAEKLQNQTRRLYLEKFGVPVYEGYGLTEASPVVSVNVEKACKHETVGKFLNNIDFRLEPIDGFSGGSRLFIKGPNIMLGYYLLDSPKILVPPPNGWHDTGDIANCDKDGFISIIGRVKRFAKIGGEMISMGAIEHAALQTWPDHQHAIVALEDPKKGEKIVLLTTCTSITQDTIIDLLKNKGFSKLYNPSNIIYKDSLPLLPTGKIDYISIQNIARFTEDNNK